ncbi:MAG TPA: cupin domain-containing protein [Candidatus Binataceae bacterium]|nr:cupin domain-containing protein [Candidatus Binataceae bacterium]
MTTELLERPQHKDQVIVLVSAEQSEGEFFRMEYLAREVTIAPRDHIHTEQEERVEVLAGTLRCRIAGVERLLRAGDKVTIPIGTPHAVWSDDPAGSRSIGEYRPAMNAEAMFRGIIVKGASRRGRDSRD